ncbi:MAG: recombinase RecT [Zavarzinia sp.]|nr:recombinase RecT [Zavarzinia sp.]
MNTNALTVTPLRSSYTGAQLDLIKRTVAADTNAEEFNLFIAVAQRAQLDPLRKQISAIVFNKNAKDQSKRRMAIITTIDGLRSIAARSLRYRPDEDEPDFIYDEAAKSDLNPLGLVRARVNVYMKDADANEWRRVPGVAYWDEFAPIEAEWAEGEDGRRRPTGAQKLSDTWKRMGRLMLAKCFDPDTEVLTSAGFQRFSEVSAPIMQVTPGGLEPVDAKPFAQAYAGPMVTLDSDDLNFCVTPNHDMVTTTGKIEAGAMFDQARSRPTFYIPRHAPGRPVDADISDRAIILSAIYLADGADRGSGFEVAVSRPRKIMAIRDLGHFGYERETEDAGQQAHTATRTITTRSNKTRFGFSFAELSGLAGRGKVIDMSLLTSLSRRQSRLFVDTLLDFDGSTVAASGVRRFYSSNPAILAAFELAAVQGGYAISNRKQRTSDISRRPNFYVTVSDRDAIGVVRWGRDYHNLSKGNARRRTGLELRDHEAGIVWCVTVPSGVIVVRRNGFSMLCGNCSYPDRREVYIKEGILFVEVA